MTAALPLDVIQAPRRAATALHPMRRRLLSRLSEPGSAASVARELGLPRQRVNYHLRELEREGLVELVDEHRKGNCIERRVRATARTYVISPEVLGTLGSDVDIVRDRFSVAYLLSAAARAIRDVATLQTRARSEKKRIATFTLEADVRFANAEARAAFAEELAATLTRLAAKYHDEQAPAGRRFRFLAGVYPAATSITEQPNQELSSDDDERPAERE